MNPELAKNCEQILGDRTKPAKVRAKFLAMTTTQFGPDVAVPPLANLIETSDRVAEVEKMNAQLVAKVDELEAKKSQPLQPVIFLRKVDQEGVGAALVLCETGPLQCPMAVDLGTLHKGEFVLMDRMSGLIVARDGVLRPTGEVARLETVPEESDGLAMVSLRDQRSLAHVSEEALASGHLKPGAEVVYDPLRHFVHAVIPSKVDGSDLLTPASELSGFDLKSLGAPHPIIKTILRIVKSDVCHPDWQSRMRSRRRRSFLFWGPTGVGKTATIKVIVNLLNDWFEELTGRREVSVVFADASHFYSPYLGESEMRIVQWFEKIAAIARREVVTRAGRPVRAAALIVLEEIEHLVRQRGEYGGSSHLFDRLESLILQYMDSPTGKLDVPIVFISTTNRKDLLDFAARRRFAEREVRFSTLSACAAMDVLEKKVPEDMLVHPSNGEDQAAAREGLLHMVLHYLYGEGDSQVLAEVKLRDSTRRQLCRRDLVTGGIIEMAVSCAIDEALERSEAAEELLGIQASVVIQGVLTRIVLIDGDVFEERNRGRMDVPELGNKAVVWCRVLSEKFGRPKLLIRPVDQFLKKENVRELILEHDLVFSCVDNHATRKLLSDRCQELRDVVLISGGNDGVEGGEGGTYGNVQVFRRSRGVDLNPPLTRFHPEIAHPADAVPDLSCADLAATSAPQILFANLAAASSMLNAFYRLFHRAGKDTMYDEVCFDIMEARVVPHWLSPSSRRRRRANRSEAGTGRRRTCPAVPVDIIDIAERE